VEVENTNKKNIETTDSWSWGEIFPLLIKPRPEGTPPAGEKEKKAIAVSRGVILSGFMLWMASTWLPSGLPSCGSEESSNLVEEIVNGLPIVQRAGAKFVDLKAIDELGFNDKSEIRSCSATLITTAGENKLQYSVEWKNKDESKYYINVRIL